MYIIINFPYRYHEVDTKIFVVFFFWRALVVVLDPVISKVRYGAVFIVSNSAIILRL